MGIEMTAENDSSLVFKSDRLRIPDTPVSAWSRTVAMMLRSRDLFSTNPLGASTSYAVGKTVEHDGGRWRITRHRVVPTTPEATIHVYGKRVA